MKLLFLVTEDWYFVSHRLGLAQAARAAGYDVCVVTRVRECADIIGDAGLRLIPFENARQSLNPLLEVRTLWRLLRIYLRERPDVAHHVAMKPMLYGTLAARLAGTPRVINAVAGMGWLFTSSTGATRLLKPIVRRALRRALEHSIALVQNADDAALVLDSGVPAARIRRVSGSGVDLARFTPSPETPGPPVVLFPARLLRDKGLLEFVDAARQLRAQGVSARFVLAGEPDLNPTSVTQAEVDGWVREGVVESAGWVEDMAPLMAAAAIVCLPSYREGLPKALVEAAASGRPIVTTDVPGCRAVVEDGYNGLLVAPRDAAATAAALRRLLDDASLRQRLGANGRRRAEQEFGLDAIIQQTLALYSEHAG